MMTTSISSEAFAKKTESFRMKDNTKKRKNGQNDWADVYLL